MTLDGSHGKEKWGKVSNTRLHPKK